MPFTPGAVAKAAGKAMGRAGGNIKRIFAGDKPAQEPEEFQTAVDAGENPDLDKPGVAQSVIKGLPDMTAGVADTFDRGAQRSQSRLDAMQTPEQIAAQGPISRILSSYGGE